MQIKVLRSVFTDVATLGKMFIDEEFFAYTLEDTNRDLNGDCSKKVKNETCIDAGNYKVVVNHSAHFNKTLPQILDVPCFEGVRIHGGNGPADTEGCILIGAESDMQTKIWNCHDKVAEITSRIQNVAAGELVSIEITNEVIA